MNSVDENKQYNSSDPVTTYKLPFELIQVWSCITALQGYGGCNMSLCRNAVYNINLWGATIFLLELKNKTEKLR